MTHEGAILFGLSDEKHHAHDPKPERCDLRAVLGEDSKNFADDLHLFLTHVDHIANRFTSWNKVNGLKQGSTKNFASSGNFVDLDSLIVP